jgi:hypothetical protein
MQMHMLHVHVTCACACTCACTCIHVCCMCMCMCMHMRMCMCMSCACACACACAHLSSARIGFDVAMLPGTCSSIQRLKAFTLGTWQPSSLFTGEPAREEWAVALALFALALCTPYRDRMAGIRGRSRAASSFVLSSAGERWPGRACALPGSSRMGGGGRSGRSAFRS